MTEALDPVQAQLIAARRTQILDAATRVFADKGFHRATIRDVAQVAGVADGTIYNYFTNKTDLLLGLLDRLNATEQRPVDFTAAAAVPFPVFFQAYLQQRMAVLWSNSELLRAVLPEVLANPVVRARYFEQIIAPTLALGEGYIQMLVGQGQIRPVDVPLLTRALAGMILGLLVEQLLGDTYLETHWRDLPAMLNGLLLHGLAPTTGDDHEFPHPTESGESAV